MSMYQQAWEMAVTSAKWWQRKHWLGKFLSIFSKAQPFTSESCDQAFHLECVEGLGGGSCGEGNTTGEGTC